MAATRRNLYLIVLIENLYAFYNIATIIFGVVFFYRLFNNILFAILPLALAHIYYLLLIQKASVFSGKLGSRKSMALAMLILLTTPIPIVLYEQSGQIVFLFLWFWIFFTSKLFLHVPGLYIYGMVTDHARRGKQVSQRRIAIAITQALAPVASGFLLANAGFLGLVLVAALGILISLVPIFMLPNVNWELNVSWPKIIKNPRIHKLWLTHIITELHHTGAARVWTIFLFVSLGASYSNLGLLLTATTTLSIIAIYLFGKVLDQRDRTKSFVNASLLISLSNLLRAIPSIPVAITDTYTRVVSDLHIEANEVLNFDLMNDDIKQSDRDEIVLARELGVNMAIAISYIFVALLATLLGFEFTFVIIGVLVLFLSLKVQGMAKPIL